LSRKSRNKLRRSKEYREQFLKDNPGIGPGEAIYICTYCGKLIGKENMQVDHIVSIDAANNSFLLRKLLVPDDGINSSKNLTCACPTCNRKKSNKSGFWIVRGKTGQIVQRTLWIIALTLFLFTLFVVLTGIIPKESMQKVFQSIPQIIFAGLSKLFGGIFKGNA